MRKFAGLILIFSLLGLYGCGAKNTCGEPCNNIAFEANENTISINDSSYEIDSVPILYNGKVYISVSSGLEACGYSVSFDDDKLIAEKKKSNISISMDGQVSINNKDQGELDRPIYYKDILYVTEEVFSKLTGDNISVNGDVQEIPMNKRDLLEDTEITDEYRLNADYVKKDAVYVFDEKAVMERLYVTDESAKKYAKVINDLAGEIPNSNIYCMAVPTVCEFYIPKDLYSDETSGIKKLYKNLDDDVMPINIVKPLMEHADEKIYFNTDHHWTQRGAYYAYCSFMDNLGLCVTDLDEFETANVEDTSGSFGKYAPDETELLEKFLPRYETKATSYYDMNMEKKVCDFQVINKYAKNYAGSFIGGDSPLAVIRADNDCDRSILIVKESFGTAFSTWAIENYSDIYVVDPREFNGFNGKEEIFKIGEFCENNQIDDVLFINYPGSIGNEYYRKSLRLMGDK